MAAKDTVESTIAGHKVVIFSKTYCGYCRKAKATLGSLVDDQSDIVILELDERDDGADIQAYLKDKTGQSSVPNIFINNKHVGGNDAVQAAKASGELQKLLAP